MLAWLTAQPLVVSIKNFMESPWVWPTVESLHFIGLAMLIGSVGLFDLRLLGIGKSASLISLHRVIPFGVLGFFINVMTGVLFFLAAPDQYAFNPAFQTKMALIVVAGMNMLIFYQLRWPVLKLTELQTYPFSVQLAAILSLCCWMGVIIAGRLITYYRPPYLWCFWC